MYRFQHFSHLYLLAFLPVAVLLFMAMLYWRKSKVKAIGDEELVSKQLKGFIAGRNTTRFIILSVALASVIIGFANLQKGDKTDNVQRKGVDVIIALDVSKSMLATDVQPSRLIRAKQLIQRMMDKMHNDRIGLIVFAGRAYLQSPLTIDYNAVKMVLRNAGPDMVPAQGTVFSDAIDLAVKSFSQNEKKYKALVIISDGEDHDEHAVEKVKDAVSNGIVVHTMGIGSPQGVSLIDPDTKQPKLDENGEVVISKLNEAELQSIAATGRGSYTLLKNTDDAADKLMDEIQGMEQRNMGVIAYQDYISYFQYFLLAAFIALIIESLLPYGRVAHKNQLV